MKLGEIYRKAIYLGMKNDPRSEEVASKELERAKKEFEELNEGQKKEFDLERLDNPYADTRLLYGEKEREVEEGAGRYRYGGRGGAPCGEIGGEREKGRSLALPSSRGPGLGLLVPGYGNAGRYPA